MYHRIASETFDPWNLAVTREAFAEQLSWLAQHRTVLRLAEFADLHRCRKLPRDAIALTFDDGYACTAETAAPMLEEAGLPATVFVAAGAFKPGGTFWWDELQQIVIEHEADSLTVDGDSVAIGTRDNSDWHLDADRELWTSRQSAYYRLWQRLRPLSPERLEAAMSELREQSRYQAVPARCGLMTVAQMRAVRSDLIEYGSHAMSHASLPHLASAQKNREIRDSALALQALTGARPSTFAYPFGDFDEECEEIVRDAQYLCACTAEPRGVSEKSRLFALPRVQAESWTARDIARAMHAL